MNLNEFFYYKTKKCVKQEHHLTEICYFSHDSDIRRPLIDFNQFVSSNNFSQRSYKEEIVSKTIIPFYTDDAGFENEAVNKMLFPFNPCHNFYEYKYHICHYKKVTCKLKELGLNCPYGKLCADIHKDEIWDQEGFDQLRTLYERLKDDSKLLTRTELIDIYDKINGFDSNNYVLVKFEKKGKQNQAKKKIIACPYKKKLDTKKLDLQNDAIQILNKLIKIDSTIINDQAKIKKDILEELNNIPTLTKGDLFNNLINVDNSIVFISSTPPKKEEINKLLIAFLNSHNGIIIYGADVNSGKVNGIIMDRKTRDLFRQAFNTEYKDYLIEYESNIKYKFYDLEDFFKTDNTCILVIKVKKIKETKMIFDPFNKSYVIKEKFLKRFATDSNEKIKMSDIKQLNLKEFVEITKNKFIHYYQKKLT